MSHFSDARDVIAGGVNSPVRAFAGVGGEPIFFRSAKGAWLEGEDDRRYIDYGVFQSLREMHAMIEAEVKRRELRDNIKLGPGGIREAEFVVQSMQLVRGGNDPGLQACALQDVLPLLVNNRGLSSIPGGRHTLERANAPLRPGHAAR